jgi:hypothetical protein
MKILSILDLIDVCPGRKVDVGLPSEMISFSVDNKVNISLKNDDYKMVFRSPWL